MFDTSGVQDFSYMFANASSFNSTPPDFLSQTNVSSMFRGASSFNQPLNNATGTITNMDYMFDGATVFNQDLSDWCVTLIPSEPVNFSTASSLTTPNKPVWGTCPV